MMKKVLTILAAVLLMLTLALPGAADEMYVIDNAGLLREQEWLELEARAEKLAKQYEVGIYVITLEDYSPYGYDMKDACFNIHDANGFDSDAILLLLSMEERDYYIQDIGSYGQEVLTEYGRESLEDAMLDDLGDDDWYRGFSDYLDQCEVILEAAEEGTPYDEEPLPLGIRAVRAYGIALVVGILVAAILCSVYKAQMKTAVVATSAEAYVAPQGVEFSIRQDRYTHTTRTKRKISQDSSRSGGSRDSGGGGKF